MKFQNQVLSLHSDALPADTLMVQKLVGDERMSGLFRFELDLICEDRDLDLEQVLYAPVKLGIKVAVKLAGGKVGTTTREIAGVFETFEEHEQGQGWTKYHAVMVPKLWQTTRTSRSRIFMAMSLEDLVTAVLSDDGLDPQLDFEFQLQRPGADGDPKTRAVYPEREYVVQYEESDWHFLARWLEHEGVWFCFTNEDGAEKVVFADTESSYAKSPFGDTYPYRPESSGEGVESDRFTEEEIKSFRCRQTRLPTKVVVNDYNWRVPSARLHFMADVKDTGTGVQAEYNDHFKNEAQGKALAKVRAEELSCRARLFHGSGSCRAFRPGTTFTLEGHFRSDFNRSYVLTAVRHEAEQMISLESATVTGVKYENTFDAIPDDQPFRPERTTDWPSIKGVMHAKVDAEGDGKYAELDEHGRYKLRMPFDEYSDTAAPGKASRWVRMAQPYAGANAGMHFPLLKGAEVLVTHIDGDPDRPIIAGAVPNPETESPSTGANYTRNSIRTASGNVMQIDDSESASGFVFRDAMGSRVIDYRWRTGGPAPAAANANGSLPGSGRGTATPPPTGGGSSGGTTGGGSTPPSTSPSTPPTSPTPTPAPTASTGPAASLPPEGEIISTVWDYGGVGQSDGPDIAWKIYFRDGGATPTSLQQIGTNGRYSDQTGSTASPLKLSLSHGLLTADATGEAAPLTEANVVKMFNKLLEKHPRAAETDTVSGTALTGTIGKLAKVARNLEALAAGSTIGVEVGDSIKVVVGDAYEYVDGSYDIKIGTGGYSREETRGDGTKDTYRWGKSTENEYNYGDKESTSETHGKETSTSKFFGFKHSFELEASGSSQETISLGGQSESAVKVGGFNGNDINVGIFNKNEIDLLVHNENKLYVGVLGEVAIYVAGKGEIEIAPWSQKLELGDWTDIKLSWRNILISEDKAALKKLKASLKEDCASVLKDAVGIQQTNNAISDMKNTINANTAALSTGMRSLAGQTQILAKDDVALVQASKTAVNNMTSAVTMIQ